MIEHICRLAREMKAVDMTELCSTSQNVFIENLQNWRAIAINKFTPVPDLPENRKGLLNDILELISEETLATVMGLLPAEYSPIFCHGDFNTDNVLYQANSTQGLIDFEYAGYSYDAFDLANMINETHLDYNWPEFPYWKFREDYKCDNAGIANWVKAYGKDLDFWVDVKIFVCLTNIYWGVWSLTIVENWDMGDSFDHLSYGPMRLSIWKNDLKEI